jgi:hypothetical protein
VVPTYKKKVVPSVAAVEKSNASTAQPVPAEPKVSCKLESLSESEPEAQATVSRATKYESDFIDQASAGGFNDFPDDDIEFVLRNDPEYLDLLRSRVDLDNDGSSADEHSQDGELCEFEERLDLNYKEFVYVFALRSNSRPPTCIGQYNNNQFLVKCSRFGHFEQFHHVQQFVSVAVVQSTATVPIYQSKFHSFAQRITIPKFTVI